MVAEMQRFPKHCIFTLSWTRKNGHDYLWAIFSVSERRDLPMCTVALGKYVNWTAGNKSYRSRILSTTCSFVWICGLISPDFNQDLPFSQPTRPCCYSASCPREPINPPRVVPDSRLRRCHGRRHSGIQSLYLGRELGRMLRIQVH